ncbi:hypothetical protein [Bacillus pseudomycoides]|uniref:hypothetical protein n=1 Tax=Bacillus pseudomycoides TaxID=64104 RepID=UPI0015CF79CE|nr:hypothetical protein [Bacillus pseudomycoides]
MNPEHSLTQDNLVFRTPEGAQVTLEGLDVESGLATTSRGQVECHIVNGIYICHVKLDF